MLAFTQVRAEAVGHGLPRPSLHFIVQAFLLDQVLVVIHHCATLNQIFVFLVEAQVLLSFEISVDRQLIFFRKMIFEGYVLRLFVVALGVVEQVRFQVEFLVVVGLKLVLHLFGLHLELLLGMLQWLCMLLVDVELLFLIRLRRRHQVDIVAHHAFLLLKQLWLALLVPRQHVLARNPSLVLVEVVEDLVELHLHLVDLIDLELLA